MKRADIVAAIKARGSTLRGLDRQHGLHPDTVCSGLANPRYRKVHRIVAEFIGRRLVEVWPQWYSKPIVDRRQKWRAADFHKVLSRIESGETIANIQQDKTAPAQSTVWLFAKANPDFGRRLNDAMQGRKGVKVSAERIDKAVQAIKGGSFITTQGAVSVMTLHRYRKRDANLDRLISNFYRPTGTRGLADRLAHRETMLRALRSEDVYAIAHRAVPRGLEPFMRDDVVSEVVVGLLSGAILPEQAGAAARKFASAYFGRRDLSMDADMGDGFTLAGVISDGSFDATGTGIKVATAGW